MGFLPGLVEGSSGGGNAGVLVGITFEKAEICWTLLSAFQRGNFPLLKLIHWGPER